MTEREFWLTIHKEEDFEKRFICGDNVSIDHCLSYIVPDLMKEVKPGDSILEFGCGTGRLTIPVKKLFPSNLVFGYDINPDLLEIACNRESTKIVCGSSLEQGIQFKAAYSVQVFQHLLFNDLRKALQDVYRVLVPGGIFIAQFVDGKEDAFLSHQLQTGEMIELSEFVGFYLEDFDIDSNFPPWRWIYLRKPYDPLS